jgi:hypothetical protein
MIEENKKRKIKHRPEQDLQIQCVKWFRYQYPNEILIHIPNGGKRSKVEAVRFKEMGVMSGFPDLALFKKSGGYGALFIEMKAKKGNTSDNQDELLIRLSEKGYKTIVCNSFESFVEIVSNYLNEK